MTRTLAVLALAGALGAATLANGVPARPNVPTIDRTLVCETALTGGVQKMFALAHAGTGRVGSTWKRPALAAVTTGSGSASTILDPWLAWVTAGRPAPGATLVRDPYANATFPFRVWGTVAWNTRLCRPVSTRVDLGANGLEGGAAGPFDDRYDCPTPRRVLVRLRATPSASARAGSYRQFVRYLAPFAKAELVVATEAGKKLAYLRVDASGKARVLHARSCGPG